MGTKNVMAAAAWVLLALHGGAARSEPHTPPGPAGALIAHYHMQPVPKEGPWFSITYLSEDMLQGAALAARYGGRPHAAGSAIVVVETAASFSAMHRLQSDEVWHYYGGAPLTMLLLYPDGHGRTVTLGPDVTAGEVPQVTVPHGVWQGSMPQARSAHAYWFGGTQLSPAFDPADFEMGYRDLLQRRYPAFAASIARLTRPEFSRSSAQPATAGDARPVAAPTAAKTVQAGVFTAADVPAAPVSPGVGLQELIGRISPRAHSASLSVARFTLAPGRSSGTSFNHQSEEAFIVTGGRGRVHVGEAVSAVGRDSIAFIPARQVHSIEADADSELSFYAISTPAFNPEDYVRVGP